MLDNDNKWLEAVKQSVEGIETSVPEGMWEGIASGIAAERRRRRIIGAFTSAVSAAAVIALAIVLPGRSDNRSQATALAIAEDMTFQPEDCVSAGQPDNAITSAPTPSMLPHNPAPAATVTDITDDATDVADQVMPQALPVQREPAFERPQRQPVKIQETAWTVLDDTIAMSEDVTDEGYAKIFTAGIHIDMATGAGNAPSGNVAVSAASQVPGTDIMQPEHHTRAAGIAPGYRSEYVHNMPVNIGLSLGIGLSRHLSLETGIVYSYQRAHKYNWLNSYLLGSNTQQMHYAGVPLGLRYTPFEMSRASLYVYGGVMAQKCFNASWNGSKLYNFSPVILSSHLSAGFQYMIAGPMALYIEPGASYNSVSGDDGFTMYIQHPWQFDLKGGIRFNIK